jgi:hypothetical protein
MVFQWPIVEFHFGFLFSLFSFLSLSTVSLTSLSLTNLSPVLISYSTYTSNMQHTVIPFILSILITVSADQGSYGRGRENRYTETESDMSSYRGKYEEGNQNPSYRDFDNESEITSLYTDSDHGSEERSYENYRDDYNTRDKQPVGPNGHTRRPKYMDTSATYPNRENQTPDQMYRKENTDSNSYASSAADDGKPSQYSYQSSYDPRIQAEENRKAELLETQRYNSRFGKKEDAVESETSDDENTGKLTL